MSDYTEGPRRRDRHRRHKNREGQAQGASRGASQSGSQSSQGSGQGTPQGAGQGREGQGRSSSAVSRDSLSYRDSGSPRESVASRDTRRERREELPALPKLPTPICSRCGQPIQDITSALADKTSGEAVHFDCVLAFLQGAENLAVNEKIVYIGQGRFAVMFFENPADTRKFRIVRTIEWESREAKAEWRTDISGRFSQIK